MPPESLRVKKGLGQNAVARLRECCRKVQDKVVSKSRVSKYKFLSKVPSLNGVRVLVYEVLFMTEGAWYVVW